MPDQLTREAVLPKDVAQAYREAKADLNFGLRMQKDIRAWRQRGQRGDEKIIFNFFRSGNEGDGAKALEFQLPSFGGEPYAALYPDLQSRQANLASSYPHTVKLDLKLDGKLVIGMGQASVYDNGITLHPVFGFPYLPGSSLKGVTRRTYITEHFGDDEEAALGDQQFCDLFGCTGDTEIEVDRVGDKVRKKTVQSFYKSEKDLGDRRGRLIFFDALPTSASEIAVDIVNPHYKPYYEKAAAPADIYNPVPANFIVITGGEFSAVMALDRPRSAREAEADEKGGQLAAAKAALHLALTEDGIGGKTTVGYGRFVDASAPITLLPPSTPSDVAAPTAPVVVVKDPTSVAWRKASELIAKKKAYTVDAMVASARVDGARGHYKFQPMVEELRGQLTRELYIGMALKEGDVISLELTGVNWPKKIFAVDGKSVQAKR